MMARELIILETSDKKISRSPMCIKSNTMTITYYIEEKIGKYILHHNIQEHLDHNDMIEIRWLDKITTKGIKRQWKFLD